MTQSNALTAAYNRLVHGYIHTQLLWLCSHLQLPTLLAQGPQTLHSIAEHNGCNPNSLKRFMRALCALELIECIEDERYQGAPLLAMVNEILAPGFDPCAYAAWGEMRHSVKTGEPAWPLVFGQSFYQTLAADKQKSRAFDAWNSQSAGFIDLLIDQYDFTPLTNLVDLGGGQGSLLIKLLTRYPHLHGTVFDRKEVIDSSDWTTIKNALPETIATRLDTLPGSFFDHIPAGFDGYLLSRVLLNWDEDQVLAILRQCANAMNDHSTLLIFDFYLPPSDHPNYLTMVVNDLNQLVNWGGGLRTIERWRELIADAGLSCCQLMVSDEFPCFLIEIKR